jgi:hypothetical protein
MDEEPPLSTTENVHFRSRKVFDFKRLEDRLGLLVCLIYNSRIGGIIRCVLRLLMG